MQKLKLMKGIRELELYTEDLKYYYEKKHLPDLPFL